MKRAVYHEETNTDNSKKYSSKVGYKAVYSVPIGSAYSMKNGEESKLHREHDDLDIIMDSAASEHVVANARYLKKWRKFQLCS